MKRIGTIVWLFRAALLGGFCWAPIETGARADITPAQLSDALARGDQITVIDIRSSALFQQGHIPEAINVPASVLSERKLPPLGRVVVCGGGLGLDTPEAAVRILNEKPGIHAEVLVGGFAGWESAGESSTRPKGFAPEALPHITVAVLEQRQNPEMMLVDLRSGTTKTEGNLQPFSVSGEPLTDLRQTFPKVGGVRRSPWDLPRQPQSVAPDRGSTEPQRSAVTPLLVLIDDGDGVVAQNTARALHAGGFRRVVILAGGERALSRGGQPGLQRSGGAVTAPSFQE
jgi:rhodanese-related sulfurtransferase